MQPLITKLNTDKANPATNLAAPSKTLEVKLDLPKKKASESEWSTPRFNLQALLLDHPLMDSLNLNILKVKEPTEPFSKSHPPIKLPLAHPSQDPASMELLHQFLELETIQQPTNKECREHLPNQSACHLPGFRTRPKRKLWSLSSWIII